MQQWLFVSSSGQQFTAHEPDVPALVQSGQITAQTLMWREGMSEWMPAASVFPVLFTSSATAVTQPMIGGPSGAVVREAAVTSLTAAAGRATAAGASVPAPDPAAVRRLASPLFQRKGSVKFLAVMLIVIGVLFLPMALGGLVLILAGVALMRVVGSLEKAHAAGDARSLEQVNVDMAKYFYFHALFMALNLLFLAVVCAVVVFGFGSLLVTGMKNLSPEQTSDPAQPARIEDIRFPDSPPPDSNR
jgi:multisubunit Na+/H+ antiporter MnhG subunit